MAYSYDSFKHHGDDDTDDVDKVIRKVREREIRKAIERDIAAGVQEELKANGLLVDKPKDAYEAASPGVKKIANTIAVLVMLPIWIALAAIGFIIVSLAYTIITYV